LFVLLSYIAISVTNVYTVRIVTQRLDTCSCRFLTAYTNIEPDSFTRRSTPFFDWQSETCVIATIIERNTFRDKRIKNHKHKYIMRGLYCGNMFQLHLIIFGLKIILKTQKSVVSNSVVVVN